MRTIFCVSDKTMSPVANVIRELMQERRVSVTKLAAELGEHRTTVSNWLTVRWFEIGNPDDRSIVNRISTVLAVNPDDVWLQAKPKAVSGPRAGAHLLEILFNVLEDQRAPKAQKDAAKTTIREWLKEVIL